MSDTAIATISDIISAPSRLYGAYGVRHVASVNVLKDDQFADISGSEATTCVVNAVKAFAASVGCPVDAVSVSGLFFDLVAYVPDEDGEQKYIESLQKQAESHLQAATANSEAAEAIFRKIEGLRSER